MVETRGSLYRAPLNAAVQEFDKTHVPEIVTRFEAPITARAYRRSSSAPIPDTENSRASQSFLQKLVSHSPKKARAASTLPTRCPTPEQISSQDSQYSTAGAEAITLKQESAFVSPLYFLTNIFLIAFPRTLETFPSITLPAPCLHSIAIPCRLLRRAIRIPTAISILA